MTAETFTFYIGTIRCTIIQDGMATPDFSRATQIFSSVPEETFLDAMNGYHSDERPFKWAYNPMVIETEGQTILVDTGHGAKAQPDNGNLLPNMALAGFEPGDIDTVFITHGHGDHINGLVDDEDELIFPNARCVFNRVEWEHWMGPNGVATQETDYAASLRRVLDPLREKLTLLEGGEEIAPGVVTLFAPGHTPGHTGLLIESQGEKLLDLVDTLHIEIQLLHPEWSPRFDSQPKVSPVTRREMLQKAADEKLLTRFYHLPFPGLGCVEPEGEAFVWKPGK